MRKRLAAVLGEEAGGFGIATLTMHHGTVLGTLCLRPLKQAHGALSTSLLPGLQRNFGMAHKVTTNEL